MKIPFVYECPEGTQIRNGINYRVNWSTRFCIVIKLWRLIIYARLRSANVGGRRFIFDMRYCRPYIFSRIGFSFDTLTLRVHDTQLSYEFVEDYLPQLKEEYDRRQNSLG